MKKISKKIVALVTMAMFVLTLVPFAAFAAEASATNSRIEVNGSQEVTDAISGDVLTVDFVVNATGSSTGVGTQEGLTNVKVWVTDAAGEYVDTAVIVANDYLRVCDNHSNIYKYQTADGKDVGVTNDTSFQVKFTAGGEYVIHAGVGDILSNGQFDGDFVNLNGVVKVTVADPVTTVTKLVLTGDNGTKDGAEAILTKTDNMGEFDLTAYEGWDQNGTAQYTITGKAYVGDNAAPEGKEVKLVSGDPQNLQFKWSQSETTVTTDNFGTFKFTITMNDKRNLPIYITVDGMDYALNIINTKTTASNIVTAKDGGYVLATTDRTNWDKNMGSFADAVLFTLKDVNGNVLTGDTILDSEPAADYDALKHAQCIAIEEQPGRSTLEASDLELVVAGDAYTLAYVGDVHDKTTGWHTDLYPGKYVVRVALANADYASVTFYAANYGTTQDLVLDMTAYDISTLGSETPRAVSLSDQVTLGQRVIVEALYVDGNGLRIQADNVYFGVDGKAVIDEQTNYDKATDQFWFSTKLDIAANESLLGTTIVVKAYDKNSNANAAAELTVVDSYNTFSLDFDPVEGKPNQWNDVTVTVTKEDGTRAQVPGKIVRAFVADQSNEDAIITVKVDDKDVEKGKGELSLYATEETTAEIVVVIQDSSNDNIYSGTLEYTFGDGDFTAHHEITMAIGSNEYVVDKQLFTMDAAPYVDDNWRTMVPLRALMEGFDADVEWDNDARTVTVEYNETVIVLTIGDTTYTINGEEFTMDTEPVISGDRAYVPIRFVAEAMGFQVTPLYNANGATGSVVFQS